MADADLKTLGAPGTPPGSAVPTAVPPPAAAGAAKPAPGPRPPAGKRWQLTDSGAIVCGREFTLRPAATKEVLLAYLEQTAIASRTRAVLMGALDAISEGRVSFKDLLERTRATVRAEDLAEQELLRLTQVFCKFYEPDGIDLALDGEGELSEFAKETVRHFAGRRA